MRNTTGKRHPRAASLAFLLLLLPVALMADTCGDMGAPPEPARQTTPDGGDAAAIWDGHSVAFTFTSDDGNADNRVWADVFREYGLRYTMFVTTRWVGLPGKLTVEDLRRLNADGFEIGGHGVTHTTLTTCSDPTLVYEMVTCRDTLATMIDAKEYRTHTFAYPSQAHDERVMAVARRLFIAARDGGVSPSGHPNFSEGDDTWENTSLYEVPVAVTMASLTGNNSFNRAQTAQVFREKMGDYRNRHRWICINAHKLTDCDATHMRWILETLIGAGGVWIAPFRDVAAVYRRKAGLPPLPEIEAGARPGPGD
jgi:peptidoglycan/xylan/chitin deacetylase (PgdA/CDA1 family)